MMRLKTVDFDTLEEYYNELYKQQSIRHSVEYLLVHDEIKKRLAECTSYTELGVNQGTTLATALQQHPSIVRAYDIKLKWYNQVHDLFVAYTTNHSIDYKITECSSVECEIAPTDLLYIDTLHEYEHLHKELSLHGSKVKKYIICHDTAAQPGLKQAVKEYVAANKEWTIVTDCTINVGFMTLKRNK